MKQLQHLESAYQEMQENGVTKKQLRDKYHLTEWGARKFVDLAATRSDIINGRGTKKYFADKALAEQPKDVREKQIPVTTNYSTEIRENQHDKRSRTQDARELVEHIENKVKAVETPAIEWDDDVRTHNGQDVILHETDTHIGALVENEHGEVIFDSEKAEELFDKKLSEFKEYLTERHVMSGNNIDTIHWLLGGDIVEGTGIYSGQAHELDLYINEQLEKSSELLIKAMKTLTELADQVDAQLQIVCVPGNHGDMRVKGSNNQASFDDIIYHTLTLAMDAYLDANDDVKGDVRVKRSDGAVGMTFPIRNFTGYLTHGENLKEHVGTSSGKRDALSLQSKYDCDVIFRGHYHMPKIEDVNGMPVVMTPSIKPGGVYEDSIQAYGEPGYVFYTADDENPVKDARYYRT